MQEITTSGFALLVMTFTTSSKRFPFNSSSTVRGGGTNKVSDGGVCHLTLNLKFPLPLFPPLHAPPHLLYPAFILLACRPISPLTPQPPPPKCPPRQNPPRLRSTHTPFLLPENFRTTTITTPAITTPAIAPPRAHTLPPPPYSPLFSPLSSPLVSRPILALPHPFCTSKSPKMPRFGGIFATRWAFSPHFSRFSQQEGGLNHIFFAV